MRRLARSIRNKIDYFKVVGELNTPHPRHGYRPMTVGALSRRTGVPVPRVERALSSWARRSA